MSGKYDEELKKIQQMRGVKADGLKVLEQATPTTTTTNPKPAASK